MTGRNMWTKHCSRTPGRPCWWILRNWTRFFRSGKNDYLVIVTRGHRCDADAEAFALRTGASYIGVVGSRRRQSMCAKNWKRRVFTGEQLDSVYAPIGIEIGSETPAEIAISIAAQLIQIRSAKTGKRKGAHPALHT